MIYKFYLNNFFYPQNRGVGSTSISCVWIKSTLKDNKNNRFNKWGILLPPDIQFS